MHCGMGYSRLAERNVVGTMSGAGCMQAGISIVDENYVQNHSAAAQVGSPMAGHGMLASAAWLVPCMLIISECI